MLLLLLFVYLRLLLNGGENSLASERIVWPLGGESDIEGIPGVCDVILCDGVGVS